MYQLGLCLPLAHGGELHWYLVLIGALPVLLVVYGAFRTTRDNRRKTAREEEPSTASEGE